MPFTRKSAATNRCPFPSTHRGQPPGISWTRRCREGPGRGEALREIPDITYSFPSPVSFGKSTGPAAGAMSFRQNRAGDLAVLPSPTPRTGRRQRARSSATWQTTDFSRLTVSLRIYNFADRSDRSPRSAPHHPGQDRSTSMPTRGGVPGPSFGDLIRILSFADSLRDPCSSPWGSRCLHPAPHVFVSGPSQGMLPRAPGHGSPAELHDDGVDRDPPRPDDHHGVEHCHRRGWTVPSYVVIQYRREIARSPKASRGCPDARWKQWGSRCSWPACPCGGFAHLRQRRLPSRPLLRVLVMFTLVTTAAGTLFTCRVSWA